MKNVLNLTLLNALVVCAFASSIAASQNPEKHSNSLQDKCMNYGSIIKSANINEPSQKPQYTKVGGFFSVHANTISVLKGQILVGEKNDDTKFSLPNYARYNIPKNSTLELGNNSSLIVQRDGRLSNHGTLIVNKNSSLIAPTLDISDFSKEFTKNKKGELKLRHGVDNNNGTIIVYNGGEVYWKEIRNGIEKKSKTTIYKGIVDFRNLITNILSLKTSINNLFIHLEDVKIKLFDSSISKKDMLTISNSEIFKNVSLGNDCVLDGNFDFPAPSSSVTRASKTEKHNGVTLSKDTVIRKNVQYGIPENELKGLFENGDKLIINSNQQDEEKIDYKMKQLLVEFNDPKKITIINVDYTDLNKIEYYSNYLNKELTSDWATTIDNNIFPLYSDLFTQKNNKSKINRFNMYFTFEGKKDISFELQDEENANNYQIAFYRSFQNYNSLLNANLPDNKNESSNVINNFVQKYSGWSPYLKTNWKTMYKISTKDEEHNCAVLRFYKNDNNVAVLNKLILGTKQTPVTLKIDCSDTNGVPNYAQKIIINDFISENNNSQVVVEAGQEIILKKDADINDITYDNDEYEVNDEPEKQNDEEETDTQVNTGTNKRSRTVKKGGKLKAKKVTIINDSNPKHGFSQDGKSDRIVVNFTDSVEKYEDEVIDEQSGEDEDE